MTWLLCHPIISCFIKIQIGLTFLVSAYPGCSGKEAVKRASNQATFVQGRQSPSRKTQNSRDVVQL